MAANSDHTAAEKKRPTKICVLRGEPRNFELLKSNKLKNRNSKNQSNTEKCIKIFSLVL